MRTTPPHRHCSSLVCLTTGIWRNRWLIWQLTKRDVAGRYRGSLFGMIWSLFNPVLMLAVYTFVFGVVFQARWGLGGSENKANFAIVLFAGLIVYAIFSECVTRAPTAILSQPNLVKKVVFPLEVMPVVLLASALFHAIVSIGVLLLAYILISGIPPATALLLPVVIVPLCLLCLGTAWMLASLGVYLRDIGQVTTILTSALMFLSPLFFPLAALPERVRPVVQLNPISVPIEQARQVLLWGKQPDWLLLSVYAAASLTVLWLGFWWFQRTRSGFADVM